MILAIENYIENYFQSYVLFFGTQKNVFQCFSSVYEVDNFAPVLQFFTLQFIEQFFQCLFFHDVDYQKIAGVETAPAPPLPSSGPPPAPLGSPHPTTRGLWGGGASYHPHPLIPRKHDERGDDKYRRYSQ